VLLTDSLEEEYNLKHASTHLHKGVTSTVHKILTFITWLTGYCLRSLNDLFVAWTTPETTSLQLGTLIDLSRSKSELVAENARHASTIDHPASSGEPAYLSQDGPRTPGPTGKHSADLETGPLHRSARNGSRGGIVRASNSFGSTSRGQLLSSQEYPRRPSP